MSNEDNKHVLEKFGNLPSDEDHFVMYRPKRSKFKVFSDGTIPEESLKDEGKLRDGLKDFVDKIVFEGTQLNNRIPGEIESVMHSSMEL